MQYLTRKFYFRNLVQRGNIANAPTLSDRFETILGYEKTTLWNLVR